MQGRWFKPRVIDKLLRRAAFRLVLRSFYLLRQLRVIDFEFSDEIRITNRRATILHMAICYRDLKVVKLLLRDGLSPNAQMDDGYTALSLALATGHFELIPVLLDHGADVDFIDASGISLRKRLEVFGLASIIDADPSA